MNAHRTLLLLLAILLAACGNQGTPVDETSTHDDTSAHDRDDHEGASHNEEAPGHDDEEDDGHGDEHADEHGDEHDAEGTTIPADVAESSGIVVAPAAAGIIRDEHEVQGLLTPVEGRHARVVARFPGPVTSVRVGVGDTVRAGQVLATVESNISLSSYSVTAPLSGTVLARTTSVGDLAGESPMFEIADLSTLWVDVHLFGSDAQHITAGLPVVVTRLSDGVTAETTLDRVLPGTATASQSTVARATLKNGDGQWRPGAAVRARVTVAERPVPLRVPLTALQRMDGADVVFVREGADRFEARPVGLGARDGSHIAITNGLEAGEQIVVAQSYLVKADIEKAGAAHEH